MRVVTVRADGRTHAGRVEDDQVVLLPPRDVGELLAADSDWRRTAADGDGPRVALADADLAPLVLQPRKIICLGLNYEPHIREMGRELPTHPTIFSKFARCLIGARDQIQLPAESEEVDWEAELTFVIGREARRVNESDAADVIAGYTIANDVSMRDWQWRTKQWLQGKTFEASTPLGPALVTPDELDGDPGAPDLAIACEVDGQTMQQARTGELLFTPAAVVAYLSTILTLDPGDVILTGTPGGVGAGRDPKVFLSPGQTLRTTIDGLGELVNECVPESPHMTMS